MRLWHISQTHNQYFDTYDSAVVAAPTARIARRIHPDSSTTLDGDSHGTWVTDPDLVTCRYLGRAKRGTRQGVICASFNAG